MFTVHVQRYFHMVICLLHVTCFVKETAAVRNLSVSINGCDLEVTWQPDLTLTRCELKTYFMSVRPQMTSWVPLDNTYYRFGNIGTNRKFHVSVATRFHDNGCKDSTSKIVYNVPGTKQSTMTIMEANVGDTVEISGKLEGPGEVVNATWFFTKYPDQLPVTVYKDSSKTVLKLLNVTKTHAGNYTCVMAVRKCGQGEITTVSSTTRLTVSNEIIAKTTIHAVRNVPDIQVTNTSRAESNENTSYIPKGDQNGQANKQRLAKKDNSFNHTFMYISTGGGGLVLILGLTVAVVCVRKKKGRRSRRKKIVLPPRASALNTYEECALRAESIPHIYSEPEVINAMHPG